MSFNQKQLHSQLRLIHIIASIGLGAFIYSPWRSNSTFTLVMSVVIFPLLTLTGLWMWQGPRIQKWLKRGGETAVQDEI
ncbi:hypothetical protein IFO70_34660 [Phormidium tenue FACHB-886]|nr:hypothetical protein [Phormidium tenue FACHB-886]